MHSLVYYNPHDDEIFIYHVGRDAEFEGEVFICGVLNPQNTVYVGAL